MGDYDYRFREIERRMDRAERATEQVPLIAKDIAEIKADVLEVKDENRNMRRALYTTALSVVGSAVIFAATVNEFFR